MTALYLDYRPARFAELIGQDAVSRTLLNELRSGDLAHAYLFTGTRGTGKTSTARILSRAVNCLDPKDGEPCNACSACVEVKSGAAVDVLEIDAASNRGIDEMRDLREKVKFMPASIRRKVYIIDEAHMLTTEAWNAFLKTLEEPPAHVLFVLCTTEPHKVPETVRSRVQRFDFRRVHLAEIREHLQKVAAQEKIEIEPEAVELCARAAAGSVRDALSLLDQVIATGERPVTAERARIALGLADSDATHGLLRALAMRDAGGCLRAVASAFEAGADPRQFLRECSRLIRAAQLVALSADVTDLAEDESALVRNLPPVQSGFWLHALELVMQTELELRQPVDPRLQVEVCFLRLCHEEDASLLGRLELLERKFENFAGAPAAQAQTVTAAVKQNVQPVPQVDTVNRVRNTAAPAPVSTPRESAPASAAVGNLESQPAWQTAWPQLVDAVNRRDSMLAGVLRGCKPLQANDQELVVGAPYSFHLDRLREPAKAKLLTEIASQLAGGNRMVRAEYCGTDTNMKEPEAESVIENVLETFAGSRVTSSRLRDRNRDPDFSEAN